MPQTKKSKRFMSFGIVFGLLALAFSLLYHFDVIKTLDIFLALTYVIYFTGLTLLFNGAYCKQRKHENSTIISYLAGFAFIIIAAVLLIYGFVTGKISLFL